MTDDTLTDGPEELRSTLPIHPRPLDLLVHKHGTDGQRERYAAGQLPERELRDLVRDVLFAPLYRFPRFQRLEPGDLQHAAKCPGHFGTMISFKAIDSDPVESGTWRRITAALENFPVPYLMRTRCHTMECTVCGVGRHRMSILISASYDGLALSREYAL